MTFWLKKENLILCSKFHAFVGNKSNNRQTKKNTSKTDISARRVNSFGKRSYITFLTVGIAMKNARGIHEDKEDIEKF